jgi:hypothetical protein
MKIYKDVISDEAFTDWQEVPGLGITHVAVREDGSAYYWYEVDDSVPYETFRYRVVGTGWDYPRNAYVVGTYICEPFVWHVIQEM